MAKIDGTGISIDSFNDLFDAIASEYKGIYGEDINLDASTPDAQKLSIFVKAYRDMQELGLDMYNSFDPDTAIGNQLNKLIKLCGIDRIPATKSTVQIDITTSATVSLTADYVVKDILGQFWQIANAQTLTAGTTTVSFKAQDYGMIEAQANTITEFETIVLGVESITNPNSATAGRDEESDTALKIRRKKSVALPSRNTVEGLNAKLLNVNGVIDAVVYENDSNTYDSEKDLKANSIWCVVDGGIDQDIINIIGLDKNGGTGVKGSVEGTYRAQIERQDGTYRNIQMALSFDRPTEVNIFIKLDIKEKQGGASPDIEAIKNSLVEKKFFIDEDATATELYAYVYQNSTSFVAVNLELSKDDVTYYSDILPSDFNEKLVILKENITITEI